MEVENKYGLVISNNTNFVSCGNNKRIKKRSENENTNEKKTLMTPSLKVTIAQTFPSRRNKQSFPNRPVLRYFHK